MAGIFLRDLRYGFRTLARTPGFTILAIVVMGLGIGANVALFTVVRSVLLKPLPFKDHDRLVRFYEQSSDGKFPYNHSAAGVFAEWKKQARSFSDMAMSGYAGTTFPAMAGSCRRRCVPQPSPGTCFPTLGVQPALGRNFTADDDRPQANATVILSWGLWKRRFGGSPSILNQTVLLDAKPYTVIGVMPAWFSFPTNACSCGRRSTMKMLQT